MPKSLNLVRIVFVAALASCLVTGCTKEARRGRLLNRAESDFKSGAYDEAKIEYVNVLRLGGQNVTAITRLGQMWFEQGAPRKAGAFLVKARELSPNNLDNRLRLARVYDMVGERAEAQKEALFVLQQSPSNGEALMLLTEKVPSPQRK